MTKNKIQISLLNRSYLSRVSPLISSFRALMMKISSCAFQELFKIHTKCLRRPTMPASLSCNFNLKPLWIITQRNLENAKHFQSSFLLQGIIFVEKICLMMISFIMAEISLPHCQDAFACSLPVPPSLSYPVCDLFCSAWRHLRIQSCGDELREFRSGTIRANQDS